MRRTWPGRTASGGRRARAGRLLARAAAFVVALAVLSAAGAAWRLSRGPLPLGPVGDLVAAAASRALPDAYVAVGRIALVAGDGGARGLAIELDDVTISDEAGHPVFSAPKTFVKLRPLQLLAGRFRPTEVVIRDARARLTRAESGAFSFGVGAGPAAPEKGGAAAQSMEDEGAAEEGVAAVVAALGEGAETPGALASLKSVTLERLALTYDDRSSGRIWTAERADLRLVTGPDGPHATGSIVLEQGSLGPVTLRADGRRSPDGGAAFSVSFSGVSTADMVAQIPALSGMEALNAPLQGRARVAIDGAGLLQEFAADIRASSGTLRLGERQIALQGATAAFRFDPATGRFTLSTLRLAGPAGQLAASGAAEVTRDAEGAAQSVVAELDLSQLTVAAPEIFATPQSFDAGHLSLRARFDPLRIEVAQAGLVQGALTLSAHGAAARDADGSWTGEAGARLDSAEAAQVLGLWPRNAARGARDWLSENLVAGSVHDAAFAGRMGPDGPQAALTFGFSDAVVHYLRPMPPLEGGRGWASLEWDAPSGKPPGFGLTLDGGTVTAPSGGTLALAGSTLRLPDIDHPQSQTDIVLEAAGPIAAALELIDGEPLALPSKVGLDPRSVGGSAKAQVRVSLPLLQDLKLEQVKVSVSATLNDVSATPPGLDLRVTADTLALTADTETLSLEGAARIEGYPADLSVREVFDPEEGAPSTFLTLSGGLTDEELARILFDPRPYARGRALGAVSLQRYPGGAADFDARVNLSRMTLDGRPFDWRKPSGDAATLRVRGRIAAPARGAAISLSSLAFDAGKLSLRGGVRFAGDGALQSLTLSRIQLDKRIDATLSLSRGTGGLDISVGGAFLDVAAFGADMGEDGAGAAAGPPLEADLSLQRLRITGPLSLTQVTGRYERRDGRASAMLEGRAGGATVKAEHRQDGNGQTVRLTTDDAGELLRAAKLFGDGVGGRLAADAELHLEGGLRLEGQAQITDMTISEDPALKEMLARADLDAARQSGMRFDKIHAPFVLQGDRVTLGETVAYGPDIGVTIKGTYDIDSDALALDGVFSPAFAVNGALSRVPLLGDLLTGGEGRGLIAFNFSVTGPSGNPEVSVNPLSVLTPGLLRRFFELEGEKPVVETD